MSKHECTKESFLANVANHQLKVLKDDGIYRHLRLENPGSFEMHFDVVTWPGYLSFSGDMGCYVFSRVDDMFNFFRAKDSDSGINPGYWAEKLQAVCRTDGYKEFSFDLFKENLFDFCGTEEQIAFMEEELKYVDHDEYGAVAFYRDFDNDNEVGIDLTDFFECQHNIPAYRYIWCCHALVWAISKYDQAKLKGIAA